MYVLSIPVMFPPSLEWELQKQLLLVFLCSAWKMYIAAFRDSLLPSGILVMKQSPCSELLNETIYLLFHKRLVVASVHGRLHFGGFALDLYWIWGGIHIFFFFFLFFLRLGLALSPRLGSTVVWSWFPAALTSLAQIILPPQPLE